MSQPNNREYSFNSVLLFKAPGVFLMTSMVKLYAIKNLIAGLDLTIRIAILLIFLYLVKYQGINCSVIQNICNSPTGRIGCYPTIIFIEAIPL